MSVFDGIASVYDGGMLPLEWAILRRLRRRIFSALRGDVLELGVGTGANLKPYGDEARVVALDASADMLTRAVHRQTDRQTDACATFLQADVQRLPFPSGRFDAVAASLVFCSVAEPARGLAEARRVLRPGGRLVLLEHTRGSGLGAWLTDILQPLWHVWSRECHLNRETVQAVAAAGFRVRRVEQHALGIVRSIEATA